MNEAQEPAAPSANDFHPPKRPEHVIPASISARLGRLQFHRSGKFRVLQLSDIQDGPVVSEDTIRLIAAACDAARPDLVVFTGDQIAGYDGAYSRTFRKRRWSTSWDGLYVAAQSVGGWMGQALGRAAASGDQSPAVVRQSPASVHSTSVHHALLSEHLRNLAHTRDLVRESIRQFLQPLVDRGIPFAVTYGNHDFQCGLDNVTMDAIYREFPGCLNPESTAAETGRARRLLGSGLGHQVAYVCEPGTFALPVWDVNARRVMLGLALVDSGDYAREGGYGRPSQRALDFLAALPKRIGSQSIVFQHIPLPQFYNLLRVVPPTTAYAVQGYRNHGSACYLLDESKVLPGSFLGEGVSCPDRDCGEYALLRDSQGYFALFTGHDHRNGFAGFDGGILLGATPTCGFGSYGPVPERRAARLFEFDIRHPHHPRTQLLEFGELVGRPRSHRAYTFAMSHVPTSPGEVVDLLRKPRVLAGAFAGLAAGAIGVLRLIRRRN